MKLTSPPARPINRIIFLPLFLVASIVFPAHFHITHSISVASYGIPAVVATSAISGLTEPISLNKPASTAIPSESLEGTDKQVALSVREVIATLPSLDKFDLTTNADRTGAIGGVYVPGVFSLPIIPQPDGDNLFVSKKTGLVTQFRQAERYGVIGLLAHNYLSGKEFYNLEIGQEIWLIYRGEDPKGYQVSSIRQYQKLDYTGVNDEYIDLNDQKNLTTREIFDRYYRGEPHVTLQTCLEGDGRLDWGLLFVVASPIN